MAFAQALLAVGCLFAFRASSAPTRSVATQAQLRPEGAAGNKLRGVAGNVTKFHALSTGTMPCACDAGQPTWIASTRTVPKCIFIDLGAADGNTLQDFVNNKYGPVAQCPSGQWEATLVEANPRFNAPLKQTEVTYPGQVHAKAATAAYMCEAQTTFYLDTTSVAENYWGSSMSENHVDTQKSGLQAVTVPTVNVLKLLYETTIPADYVILKMDIEGAEWDVLPCLAQANSASLVDRLFVETHPQAWGNAGTTQPQYDAALAGLRAKGVDIPKWYHSQTL
jgi:FkbM family methyltransferase